MSQRESGYQRKPLGQYETPTWVTLALAKGEKGDLGETIVDWKIDLRCVSGGADHVRRYFEGPPLALRGLFEQYHEESRD